MSLFVALIWLGPKPVFLLISLQGLWSLSNVLQSSTLSSYGSLTIMIAC